MADAVAIVLERSVGRILDKSRTNFLQVLQNGGASHFEQGANDLAGARPGHRAQTGDAGAAQQPHQHGFRLIVGLMGQRDIIRSDTLRRLIQKPMAGGTRSRFQIAL